MNMRFSKKLAFGAIALASTVVLAACGKGSSDSGKNSDGSTDLTFWTFVDGQGTFFKDAAKAWNKSHPKQKINLKVSVLPFDQENQKLTVALKSGSGAPDIVDVELGQAAIQLKGTPQYYSLNSALKPYRSVLQKSRLDNFTKDGKTYGLDYHVGEVVTYYNTDLLKKAGIDYTKIKTWADYTKAGEQLKAKTGKYMNELEYAGMFQLDSMVAQQKADYYKDGKVDVNNAAVKRALQMQHDWIYKDKIARSAVGGNLDNDQFFAEMNKGNVASVTMPAWYMQRMVAHMPKLKNKVAIAPMPVFQQGDYQTAGGGGTGTMVTNQAKNKKLAAKFVVWAKASKGQAYKIWENLGFDPIRTDIWSTDRMKADNDYTEYFGKDIFDIYSKLSDQVHVVTKTDSFAPTINDYILKNTLPSTILKDKMTPTKALDTAQAALKKQQSNQ
ncbi:ABC transporter substrate-binding protein [Lacticaseibacillus nasuensis]|uniref:Uncharacterized protein n=1 Tax=Lacticaseibacillus nasuensis JCM 17158 TaxID=1291734 RepID=A0A0R1JGQ2_9LACO|nr:ABC transporter substrate-binding protein [Lacticaseibacillus nasuensis]KRK70496.1 hypothetical protein FD02_GL000565 [Lacticaseibacillus nasuensis JCM 17158]